MYPTDRRYSKEHEWVQVDGEVATIGITHFAQDQLGDIVFVELPEVGEDPVSKDSPFAVVESVNLETREVVLNRADGEIISFIASDNVRNLDQVEPGDVVTANYEESLSIEVIANEGFEPGEVELAAVARAEEGQKPGMAAIDTVVETATVEDINIEANTFKLRTADGAVNEYTARNPENLKRAKVGDLVVFTVVNTLAISVTEQPSE